MFLCILQLLRRVPGRYFLGLRCIATLGRRVLLSLDGIRLIFLFRVLFCRCILACICRGIVRKIGVLSERMWPLEIVVDWVFIDLVCDLFYLNLGEYPQLAALGLAVERIFSHTVSLRSRHTASFYSRH